MAIDPRIPPSPAAAEPLPDLPEDRRLESGRRAAWLSGGMMFTAVVAVWAVLQFATPAPVGVDGYYHLRMAQLIRNSGWMVEFRWLPLTILSPSAFYDHHLLYHLLLAPFAWGDPSAGGAAGLALGGKLASVLIAALASLAVWLGLHRRVRWAGLWTLGLFALSEAFLYRLSMPRAQSASLLLLVIGFFLLVDRRDLWLVPLGFVYVWLYDAFPLLLLISAARVAADLVVERRLNLRPVVYGAVGITLGLVLNPYFPRDVVFVLRHLLPKLGALEIPVGNEWYPYDAWTLVTNSGLAYAAFGAGLYFLGKRPGRIDRMSVMAFLVAAVFGLAFLRARRFAEYFPPFSLIFLAISASPWLERLKESGPWHRLRIPAIFAALFIVPLGWTTLQAHQTIADSSPLDRYGAAASWMAGHSRVGDMVFLTDWDDFPRLFFYDTTNAYVLGLDPTYLQLADETLYDDWVAITRGEVKRPSLMISARFGARYVFSDLGHGAFLTQARIDPGLEEVYRDRSAIIYRVLASGEG